MISVSSILTSVSGKMFDGLQAKALNGVMGFLSSPLSLFSKNLSAVTNAIGSAEQMASQAAALAADPIGAITSQAASFVGGSLNVELIERMISTNAVTSLVKANLPSVPGEFSAAGIMAQVGSTMPTLNPAVSAVIVSAVGSMPSTKVSIIGTKLI